MALDFWKKAGAFLLALNVLLLAAAWMMALYTYPRIPTRPLAPLSVLGLGLGSGSKSILFYLCPALQTLLTMAAVAAGRMAALRSRNARLGALRREHIYLGMIFVNAMFIHLQRNVISLAAAGRSSLQATYLLMLAVVVFLIYLYYRVRRRSLRL